MKKLFLTLFFFLLPLSVCAETVSFNGISNGINDKFLFRLDVDSDVMEVINAQTAYLNPMPHGTACLGCFAPYRPNITVFDSTGLLRLGTTGFIDSDINYIEIALAKGRYFVELSFGDFSPKTIFDNANNPDNAEPATWIILFDSEFGSATVAESPAPSQVPLPGGFLLLASGFLGFLGLKSKK